jgi:hypothetical protein
VLDEAGDGPGFQRDDALVDGTRALRIERQYQPPMIGAAGQVGERGIGAKRTDSPSVPLRGRAESERFRAFDDEQANGTVALQLHDEAPRELERRCKQRRRCDKLREHTLQWRRIAVAGGTARTVSARRRAARAANGGMLEPRAGNQSTSPRRAAPRWRPPWGRDAGGVFGGNVN